MRRTILAALLILIALSVSAKTRFPYVYARGDGNTVISHGSLEDLLKIHKRYGGEYLWAKVDGRQYLIRDAATLAEVRRAAAVLEPIEAEMRALERKMKPLEQRQERLEDELDALTDDVDDEDLTSEQRARIRELEKQIRDLERQMRPYEQNERRLDQREEELDRQFDAEIERIVERAIRNGTAGRVQ